jgi:hemoglobin-like flavoprotein
MDEATLQRFGASLDRCTADPRFLDLFYEIFLSSSPKVREKFADTDFAKQKATLRTSFSLMLRAARQDGAAPPDFLDHLATRHGASQLAVGSEFYDLWLDSLLAAVRASDPQWAPEVAEAWEAALGVGIRYLLARYHG